MGDLVEDVIVRATARADRDHSSQVCEHRNGAGGKMLGAACGSFVAMFVVGGGATVVASLREISH